MDVKCTQENKSFYLNLRSMRVHQNLCYSITVSRMLTTNTCIGLVYTQMNNILSGPAFLFIKVSCYPK